MDQSLKDQWWLKKKGRFSVNATWVNCNINLRIPTERANKIVNSIEPGKEEAQ